MIQFNLLPDVKLEYIKARRTKRLVMLGSAAATAVSLALVVILFIGVNVLQKGHMDRLQSDIKADSKKLQDIQDLGKILTVQNQLNSLNGLHETKPAAERLGGYLSQITPNEVTISTLDVDFGGSLMTITGSAGQLHPINEFIDTLKFTKYKADGGESVAAFNNVVLAGFTRSDEDNEKPATYEIKLNFDPVLFENSKSVTLEVPNTVTTRSTTERPNPLFQHTEDSEGEGH